VYAPFLLWQQELCFVKKKWVLWLLVLVFLGGIGVGAWKFFFPRNHCVVPLQFLPTFNTFYINVEIEKKRYDLQLDLGFAGHFKLKKEFLDKIQKKDLEKVSWFDLQGIEYESNEYQVPKIKMGKVTITKAVIKEENEKFCQNNFFVYGERTEDDSKRMEEYEKIIAGTIGSGIFQMKTIQGMLIDCANSVVIIIKNLNRFHEKNYPLEQFTKIPFEMFRSLIILPVETDLGKRGFLLDSGASCSMVKASLVEHLLRKDEPVCCNVLVTSKMIIGDKDFGETRLTAYPLSKDIEQIDGILGMDFIKEHVILLDFSNNIAYIKSTTPP
jgi:hypothetical protein